MILNNLKLNNFRVFKGVHNFSLAPRNNKPIILFGGLNGAGKTTTLTAIRLALYGRQFLGVGTTQKSYYKFLSDSIYSSKSTGVKMRNSSVELTFSYASAGKLNEYCIKRSWTELNGKINEDLKIFKDLNIIENLSYEQAQGFLNELIPIGVSDLFFFDGEKIAQLAEDDGGNILSDSVKKLIGLDVIEKLIGDITVFIRNQNKQKMPDGIKSKILNLEKILETQEEIIEIEQNEYISFNLELIENAKHIDLLTNNLNTHGGAWAASREEEIKKLSEYKAKKELIISQIQEIISGAFPFAIAPDFVEKCIVHLNNELDVKRNKNISFYLTNSLISLENRLNKILDKNSLSIIKKEINEEFGGLLSEKKDFNIIHDVSESVHQKILVATTYLAKNQKNKVAELNYSLKKINTKIEDIGINIGRAPDKNLLNIRLQELNQAQIKNSEIVAKTARKKETIRVHLREAIKTVRALEKLHDSYILSDDNDRALEYAYKAEKSLNLFSKRVATNKIQNVENEFISSFKRLARKNDINVYAKIEPQTFAVKLFDDSGNEILKESLSAGERQIYAIAMLNALAKTSGRRLPIIIDTPLGRLDSKHRKKLIENYFPYASHQVIILSTDTEIGESYFLSLKEHISHSIMLNYENEDGSSNVNEGYFWG